MGKHEAREVFTAFVIAVFIMLSVVLRGSVMFPTFGATQIALNHGTV